MNNWKIRNYCYTSINRGEKAPVLNIDFDNINQWEQWAICGEQTSKHLLEGGLCVRYKGNIHAMMKRIRENNATDPIEEAREQVRKDGLADVIGKTNVEIRSVENGEQIN